MDRRQFLVTAGIGACSILVPSLLLKAFEESDCVEVFRDHLPSMKARLFKLSDSFVERNGFKVASHMAFIDLQNRPRVCRTFMGRNLMFNNACNQMDLVLKNYIKECQFRELYYLYPYVMVYLKNGWDHDTNSYNKDSVFLKGCKQKMYYEL